jgi:hypothetical protein
MFQGVQILTLTVVAILGATMISCQSIFVVYASSSPYNSGYDHGCDDAGIPDPGDRYINQPEKGPTFHTGEFMSGYDDGFSACSGAQTTEDDDDNDLPLCKNGVVQDCQVPGGITCLVEERDDPCMDIWYGMTAGGWPECCDGSSSGQYFPEEGTKEFNDIKDCVDDVYEDGLNHPFSSDRYEECDFDYLEVNPYYDAFINGCKNAGNSEETCERFID